MNKIIRIISVIVVILALIWVGYTLFNELHNGSYIDKSNESIKLGFIAPLSGDAAVYGEPTRNIVAMAVEEINNAGGINGKKLEVIYEDGKCNGNDGARAAQKLVNVDHVQIILGGWCSSESLAAVPVAEAGKVALFSFASSSPELTGKSPYFFRDYPSDATQGKVLADLATAKGWKNIAFIQEQTDYALGVYTTFSGNFQGKINKEEFPTETTDFRSILTKLKATKSNALFIDSQTPAVAERILKQVKELGWHPALLINDAISGDPKTVADNKDMLEGAFTAQFGVDPANPKFQSMIAAYKAKYGEEPPYQSYAQTEYDSVYITRDGLLAVGNNGQKFAQWSRTIKDWSGASGSVTIQSNGDMAGGHVLKVIHNGEVGPYIPK